MERTLKIILAILLFLCLLDMPYRYYQFVRLISFGLFAYLGVKESNQMIGLIYFGLALLFQPFIKIALGREVWNIVDVIVGIGLLVTLIQEEDKQSEG